MKKTTWVLFAVLCICISLYPVVYLMAPWPVGLLTTKPPELLSNLIWKTGFLTHIIFGGLALLTGWSQFSKKWRSRWLQRHRNLGKIYIIAAWLSSAAGIFIGMNATGGIVAQTGFIALGMIWFTTTTLAYTNIKRGNIDRHEYWMIYSYAACFAAVTLRLYLPLLIIAHQGAFDPAYRIVAWLCWVPNILVAFYLNRSLKQHKPDISV